MQIFIYGVPHVGQVKAMFHLLWLASNGPNTCRVCKDLLAQIWQPGMAQETLPGMGQSWAR
jgi:hypothetical protein